MDALQTACYVSKCNQKESQRANFFDRQTIYIMRIPKIRYFIGVPYLYYIAMMGGNILWEAMVLGLVCAFTDFLLEGGGKPPLGG
jgi:hypothetical protein